MKRRHGLSLAELMVVLLILVLLAGMIVPMISRTSEDAQRQTTEANLVQLRDVIMNGYRPDLGSWPRPGSIGLGNGRQNHPQLRYLFVNPANETAAQTYDPVHRLGWKGPYLLSTTGSYALNLALGFTNDYGENGDPTVLDGWGRPIVMRNISGEWFLVSAGLDGSLGNADDLRLKLQ